MATVGMPSGDWTMTSAATDEETARWYQLKRTFNVSEALQRKRETIRKRAAEIHAFRLANCGPGTPLDDWLQAEGELRLGLIPADPA